MTVILALHKQKLLNSCILNRATGVSHQKGVRYTVFHRGKWEALATNNHWNLREGSIFLKNQKGFEPLFNGFIMNRDKY